MDDATLPSLDDLRRRKRAAYTVLASGVAITAWILMLDYGLFAFFRDNDSLLFLFLGAAPYALAALATWLFRRSWEATSWLFGTWVFMTAAAALFLFRFAVWDTRSGFFSELIYLLPPLAQVAVVLFAAAVAFALHRRDLDRF